MEPVQARLMSSSNRDGTEVVRSRSALAALATEWNALAVSAPLPMLSHAWVLSCAETLYREDELFIITVRAAGVLAGVAPLVAQRRSGVIGLTLIGNSYLYEPSGLLYKDHEGLDALLGAIVDARRPLVLSRIPTEAPILSRLRSIGGGRTLQAVRQVIGTLGVPISSGWKDYVSRLSAQRRYDLKRARRRAEEAGKVTYGFTARVRTRPRPCSTTSCGWSLRAGRPAADPA